MAKVLAFKSPKPPRPTNVLLKGATRAGQGRPTDQARGRVRSHLTAAEVKGLIAAAGTVGRHPQRDRTLVLMAYRHGLRVSELVALQWDQVDFAAGTLYVRRLKSGTPATHPLAGDELRALRALQKAYEGSRFIFATERRGPLTRSGVNKLVARAGQLAKIRFPVTPHQLRHACGFYLANKGIPTRHIQAYLGHKSIQHTVRYTALSDQPFRNFWD